MNQQEEKKSLNNQVDQQRHREKVKKKRMAEDCYHENGRDQNFQCHTQIKNSFQFFCSLK